MQTIRMDFDNPGLPKYLDAMEGDAQSRFFNVELYRNGTAYVPLEGAVFSIMYSGPGSQNGGWYDTITDGKGDRDACKASGNLVTCEIDRHALQTAGHLTIILCVTTDTGYMLKSWPIHTDVKSSHEDPVETEMYFNLAKAIGSGMTNLTSALNQAKIYIETIKNSSKAALSGIESAKNDVLSTINDRETEAKKNIENKAAESLATIPEDYTEMEKDVGTLQTQMETATQINDRQTKEINTLNGKVIPTSDAPMDDLKDGGFEVRDHKVVPMTSDTRKYAVLDVPSTDPKPDELLPNITIKFIGISDFINIPIVATDEDDNVLAEATVFDTSGGLWLESYIEPFYIPPDAKKIYMQRVDGTTTMVGDKVLTAKFRWDNIAELKEAKRDHETRLAALEDCGLSVVDGMLCVTYDDGVSTVDIPESEAENV